MDYASVHRRACISLVCADQQRALLTSDVRYSVCGHLQGFGRRSFMIFAYAFSYKRIEISIATRHVKVDYHYAHFEQVNWNQVPRQRLGSTCCSRLLEMWTVSRGVTLKSLGFAAERVVSHPLPLQSHCTVYFYTQLFRQPHFYVLACGPLTPSPSSFGSHTP